MCGLDENGGPVRLPSGSGSRQRASKNAREFRDGVHRRRGSGNCPLRAGRHRAYSLARYLPTRRPKVTVRPQAMPVDRLG